MWQRFYNKHQTDNDVEPFIELFQFVQIKTYSEAICETVGSIMTIHRGRGRNLHPVNFSKEIYLNFNLPPLHVLSKNFIPKIVNSKILENKKYYRKLEHSRPVKLKNIAVSSSIMNFREDEECRSHLPLKFLN